MGGVGVCVFFNRFRNQLNAGSFHLTSFTRPFPAAPPLLTERRVCRRLRRGAPRRPSLPTAAHVATDEAQRRPNSAVQ